jgi:hypothetical protein
MSHERYKFYFKIPNRNEPILYSFHSNITLNEFIEFIKEEMLYFSPKNIEIFEFVDNIKINKLNYNESYLLNQIFKDRVKETSFCIKFIDN